MKDPLNLNEKEFQFVKELTWGEVFEIWRKNEEHLDHWKEHYKERGFKSWAEWRKKYLPKEYSHQSRRWYLYKLLNPIKSVTRFRGGPYKGWVIAGFYGKSKTLPRFLQIIKNVNSGTKKKGQEILKNFPSPSYFIGLSTEKGVVVIEGMHRCVALALANKKDKKLNSDVFITLAEFPFSKLQEQVDKIHVKLAERAK